MKKVNWERGLFRLWLLFSSLLFCIAVFVGASAPNMLWQVMVGALVVSLLLFVIGNALCWILGGFK